jgi:hypothetical protein
VRHLFAALELGSDTMYGHIKKRKRRGEFLEFCRYLRSLHPADMRIAIVCDNFSAHLSTRKDKRVGQWAAASNVEIACTPTNSSWMNRLPVPVRRAARIHPQRHRPRHPPRAGQHDPPLHRLAEPPHRRPPPVPHRQARQRSLRRQGHGSTDARRRNLAAEQR